MKPNKLRHFRLLFVMWIVAISIAAWSGCMDHSPDHAVAAATKGPRLKSYVYPPPGRAPDDVFGAGARTGPAGPDADLLQPVAPDDLEAKDTLLKQPFGQEREGQSEVFGAGKVREWRPAQALLALRASLQALAPNRDKHDDGMIGDAEHASRNSDHNPWIIDDGVGVVSAYDVTNSPQTGCDVDKLVQSLLKAKDPRIKYIIWQRKIYNHDPIDGLPPWTPRHYGGRSPHDKHVHISVLPSKDRYDDGADWNISLQ